MFDIECLILLSNIIRNIKWSNIISNETCVLKIILYVVSDYLRNYKNLPFTNTSTKTFFSENIIVLRLSHAFLRFPHAILSLVSCRRSLAWHAKRPLHFHFLFLDPRAIVWWVTSSVVFHLVCLSKF